MEFINDDEGIKHADPETFQFNTTLMAGFRLALKWIKIPDYSPQLTGNARVLWEIFEDYKMGEGKTTESKDLSPNNPAAQHRFDIISRGIPVAIYKYFFDSAYREVGDRMLWLLIKNQHRFKFPPHHLDPACWYHDDPTNKSGGGRRLTPGLVIPDAQIVNADDTVIVVRDVLPPKHYFASIEGIDHWVSIDTNFPQWVGIGWGYRVHAVYGTQAEMEKKTLFGD